MSTSSERSQTRLECVLSLCRSVREQRAYLAGVECAMQEAENLLLTRAEDADKDVSLLLAWATGARRRNRERKSTGT